MDEELQGLFPVQGGQGGILYTGGVVGDGADETAVGFAVAGEIDVAGRWGDVFGVDVAEKGDSVSVL